MFYNQFYHSTKHSYAFFAHKVIALCNNLYFFYLYIEFEYLSVVWTIMNWTMLLLYVLLITASVILCIGILGAWVFLSAFSFHLPPLLLYLSYFPISSSFTYFYFIYITKSQL